LGRKKLEGKKKGKERDLRYYNPILQTKNIGKKEKKKGVGRGIL